MQLMKNLTSALALTLVLAGSSNVLAQAQTVSTPTINASTSLSGSIFNQLTPKPTNATRLDFTVWDELLKEMVYYTGPSLRQRASRPEATVGTRVVYGHTSPYRLEGNKVIFERMSAEFNTVIDDYIIDLVDIGNRLDIASLPRNEQLAYWLNLHNALVVQGIAANYPLDEPYRVKSSDGTSFHDIRRVTIKGVPLSLRNIREDVVYKNWSDPLVIYGFFHGDLGSPSIQRKAYTGDNLQQTLRFSGEEFANSLRGFIALGKAPKVSRHYEDAAPYFFPDFENNVRAHLAELMNEDVKEELMKANKPVQIASYETDVADLSKGDAGRSSPYPVETVTSTGSRFGGQSVLVRAVQEQGEKFRRIRRRGMFGSVTIEDVETVDTADFGVPGNPGLINIDSLLKDVTTPEDED